MSKQVYFQGERFNKNIRTNYYQHSATGEFLHRYVYKFYKGEIPENYHIHHKDHNKLNNDITNLVCISPTEHSKHHGKYISEATRKKLKANLDNIRPLTVVWHQSEEGRKWHKEHWFKSLLPSIEQKIDNECRYCKKIYSLQKGKVNKGKFCSNACKSAFRRKSGVDNVQKECVICRAEFTSNKYAQIQTCSFSCRATFAYSNRN